jgi:ATP-dependent DNA helicase RecG
MDLHRPIGEAGRVFKMYSARLAKLNILTLNDFLYHLPFRYDDYSLISKISHVQAGETVTIRGLVVSFDNTYTRSHKTIQKALINDGTGSIEAVWFNQPFLTKYIKTNDEVSLSGKIEQFNHKIVLNSPDYELIRLGTDLLHTGRLTPVYPETKGVSSKWLRRQIYKILSDYNHEIIDYLPEDLIRKYGYPSLSEALKNVHFPANLQSAEKARERLAFNELLLIRLKAKERRSEWDKKIKGLPFRMKNYHKELKAFEESLPFDLTLSQKKAVSDMLNDLSKETPMNRLLQGDVGSGKTIVGTFLIYAAFLNGYQAVFMAPTEILAKQHYETISKLLAPFSVTVSLVTGTHKLKTKNTAGLQRKIDEKPAADTDHTSYSRKPFHFDVLIGTHAVLSEKIKFNNLGLVIIDEQQRFGVEQRSIIREKGKNPHFLTMTATPIPRTVALTMYGDLDLSYLSEMPQGRLSIKTWLVPPEKRNGAYRWISEQIATNSSQAFIICPFIEESENMQTVKAATVEYEKLRRDVFPDLKMGLLHGKLKAKEKDHALQEFKNKSIDILVATPVVEVGIDIANATVIMIEAAERFGLAQLHQLRGRVGRGEKQSFCLLFTESESPLTHKRLKAMEEMHNGAELAELDLKLRGPGDVFGTAQSGIPQLQAASFSDTALLERTGLEADRLFDQLPSFPKLQEKMDSIAAQKVAPD